MKMGYQEDGGGEGMDEKRGRRKEFSRNDEKQKKKKSQMGYVQSST
jgi:hypothetical protein